MVSNSNGIQNMEIRQFEIQTNGCHFDKKTFEIRKNYPDFERSGFQMI